MRNTYKTKHDFKNAITESKIKAAIIRLLETTDITRITVGQICSRCGISRSTFYRHYKDVFDVTEKMETEVLEEYKSVLMPFKKLAPETVTPSRLKQLVMRYLHTCYYNRQLILALVKLGQFSGFHDQCLRMLYEVVIVLLSDIGWIDDKYISFTARYLASTVFSLLYTWLEQDMIDFQTFYRMYVEVYMTNIEVAERIANSIPG